MHVFVKVEMDAEQVGSLLGDNWNDCRVKTSVFYLQMNYLNMTPKLQVIISSL